MLRLQFKLGYYISVHFDSNPTSSIWRITDYWFFGGVRVVHFFSFLCCPIMCLYILSSVLWCPLRILITPLVSSNSSYDFRIKTMFGSSLPSVVCRSAHVLFTLFVFAFVKWCSTHIELWFCFVCLRLVHPMFPVFLYCLFLIAPSVFSTVYFKSTRSLAM